jgi:hypothetical protein
VRYPRFIGGSSKGQTVIASAERTVNFYPETEMPALYPTPGYRTFGTTTQIGGREIAFAEGRGFAIIGNRLFEYDSAGTITDRGTVAVDESLAQIAYNGQAARQLGISSGGNFYYYDLQTNVLTKVLDGICNVLAYAGGFGFAANIKTGIVRISNPNDFSTWDAGTFMRRSLFADPLQTIFTDGNNLLWLVGTESFETRYNSGVGTQPWIPLSGLVGGYGIVSTFAFSATGIGNSWLAQNKEGVSGIVYTRGGPPEEISSHAMNDNISDFMRDSRIDNAEILLYQQRGHTHVCVSFPTPGSTWSSDVAQKNWVERGRWDPNAGRFAVWAPRVHCTAYGKHLILDRDSGKISWMDESFTTEIDGSPIVRERTAPALIDEHKRTAIDQLELLMQVGVGTQPGTTDDNPQAVLKVSDDGGETFGNELLASIGRVGNFRQRVYWTRLSASWNPVFNVRFSSAVPIRLVDAFLNNA